MKKSLIILMLILSTFSLVSCNWLGRDEEINVDQIKLDAKVELETFLAAINDPSIAVIKVINDTYIIIDELEFITEIQLVINSAKSAIVDILNFELKNINLEVTIKDNIIRWDSIDNATYKIKVNEEVIDTNNAYLYIEKLPVTIQIQVIKHDFIYNYTEAITFNKTVINNKKISLNYYKDDLNRLPVIDLTYEPHYYHLYDSNNKLVEGNLYTYMNDSIVLSNKLLNQLSDLNTFYLITDRELITININILEKVVPYVITPVIYSDFMQPIKIYLELNGATVNIDKTNLPSDKYIIEEGILIITEYEYINSLFEDSDRTVFIFGITFKLGNTSYATSIFIYNDN